MMHFTAFTAFSLFLTISVALAVPRATQPINWSNKLEPYDSYHSRYLAYDCESQHGTNFFNQCCHPILANTDPPSQCPLSDDENEDCDDDEPDVTAPGTTNEPHGTAFATTNVRGGFVTFFYQNNTKGACGFLHTDQDLIAAMDQTRFADSPLCGKRVNITNLDNHKHVVVTIADDCPTCINANSIDLSVAAFDQLSDQSVGLLRNTEWSYTD